MVSKTNGTRLIRGYRSNFFFSSRLATKPGRALAAPLSPALAENGVTTAVSVRQAKVENDIHAAAFGLGSRLGHSWRAWDGLLDEHVVPVSDEVGQAPGRPGVALIDSTAAMHTMQCN